MEKKNIIYKIGGCGVQEMEHEKDLCGDVEIRKKQPMWINKWNANTVHSSVTSAQLQRICCVGEYTFSKAILNTDFPFLRMEHDSTGKIWKAFQFQDDVRVHSH